MNKGVRMTTVTNNNLDLQLMIIRRESDELTCQTLPIVAWRLTDDNGTVNAPVSIAPLTVNMPYAIYWTRTRFWIDPVNGVSGYGENELIEHFAEVIADIDSEIISRVVEYTRQHPDKVIVESGYAVFRKPMLATAFGDHVFSTGIASLLALKRVKFEANKYWVDLDG
jgi:hypothetical protein